MLSRQVVCTLDWVALGETDFAGPRGENVAPRPLNKLASKRPTLLVGQLLDIQIFEAVVQQAQQRTEASLDSAVRSCREQQKVPCVILGHFMHELMALLLFTGNDATGLRSCVRFVYDDEVGAVSEEGSAAGVALHEVHAHNHVLVVPIDAKVAARQVSF